MEAEVGPAVTGSDPQDGGLFDRLNAEQKQAVGLGWGPSLVIAGAGSGKTTVLTRRVAYIIGQLKQPAHSVLAVTFTNKAAGEMKERLEKMLGHQARALSIGTFHSVCARLMRREITNYKSGEGYTWNSNFVIYDETDSAAVVKGVITRLNLDEKAFAPKDMLRAISGLKNDGFSSHQFAKDARGYRDTRLSDIFTNYQSELARNNAFDFDDLIGVFAELLETNPQVRARMQDQFRHVLVDEFQDTNQAQYRLISLLTPDKDGDWAGRSLMVVGDVDQSVYSWRKADFRIILGFQQDYKQCELIKLEDNYRSTGTILDVANSIIKNNSERIDKVLRCNRGPGGKIRCFSAADEIDEAYFVVEELKRLSARNIVMSDCVLLYRTNAMSRAIEEVLVRSGVPYTMVGATRFYDRAEIKDVLAYLKLVYNNADGQSFKRVVNNPRRGLGKTTLDKLEEYATTTNMSLLDAALQAQAVTGIPAKAQKTLYDFASSVRRWNTMSTAMSVSSLVDLVLKESTYLARLEEDAMQAKDEVAMGRADNVRELLNVAREFENVADDPTLEAFLTRISLVSDLDNVNMEQDAIKLMTLHAAKGLEFGTVFLLGLEEGLFPHIRSLNSPSQMEEERRLMYVGVTRAKDRLYLTFSKKRMSFASGNYGTSSYTVPSRFLSEISPEHLTGFTADPESMFYAQRGGSGGGYEERPASYQNRDSTGGGGGYRRQDSEQYGNRSTPNQYGNRSTPNQYGNRPASTPPPRQEKPRVLSRQPAASYDASADRSKSSIEPQSVYEKLAVGDSVMHSKFGAGTVVEVIGSNDKELYNVDFQGAGKRLLDPRFAKLVKLT